MNGTLIVGSLLSIGLVLLIAYAVGVYNLLVRLSNNIDKAWSNIDVILKQQHDELPKLVEVCNSYMVHERETAYSDPSRPLIPTQVGHPFRRNAATDSEVKPATFPSPLGIGGRHPSDSRAG